MSGLACPNPACDAGDTQLMGIELPGVYDGVLLWSCMGCGHAWARDFGDRERLNEASAKAVTAWLGEGP